MSFPNSCALNFREFFCDGSYRLSALRLVFLGQVDRLPRCLCDAQPSHLSEKEVCNSASIDRPKSTNFSNCFLWNAGPHWPHAINPLNSSWGIL